MNVGMEDNVVMATCDSAKTVTAADSSDFLM